MLRSLVFCKTLVESLSVFRCFGFKVKNVRQLRTTMDLLQVGTGRLPETNLILHK